MTRRPPSSTLTYTTFPSTTLFRSADAAIAVHLLPIGIMVEDEAGRVRRGHHHVAGAAGDAGGVEQQLHLGIGIARQRIAADRAARHMRSEEHTSELQSLMRNSYAVCCLK